MNQYMSPSKTALTFAFLISGFHVAWSLLILVGWAQALIDFIFWAHMLSLPIVVKAFDATAFVTLIVVTAVIGWIFGYAMARIWNRLHRAAQ
ncbi:MAG: hypothetical protein PHD04_01950 [Candidatus Pacebacteria bacterium]|nr:hypothetical protein [Candidatus Paceibacterota bacterium]